MHATLENGLLNCRGSGVRQGCRLAPVSFARNDNDITYAKNRTFGILDKEMSSFNKFTDLLQAACGVSLRTFYRTDINLV